MTTDTIPTDTIERQRTDHLINTELRNGDFSSIRSNESNSDPEVGYVFFGGRDMLSAATKKFGDSLYDTPGLGVSIIDLTKCPKSASGHYEYMGKLFNPDVSALVVDKGQVDWSAGTGYKGVRRGEFVVLGRDNERFPDSLATTSRKHCGVTIDEETGLLTVVDGRSLNGTTLLSGNLESQFSKNKEQTTQILDTTRAEEQPNLEAIRTSEQDAVFLTDEVIGARVSEMRNSKNQHETTRILLQYEVFEPKVGLSIRDKEFMFSEIFTAGKRLHCVAYTKSEDDEKVRPTLYYKSQSDGGWRASPGFYDNGQYSKGDIVVMNDDTPMEYGQYTQGTKPTEHITSLLEEMEVSRQTKPRISVPLDGFIKDIFNMSRLSEDGVNTSLGSQVELTAIRGKGMDQYLPGRGFMSSTEQARFDVHNMELPIGFEPDFSQESIKSYAIKHTMLGRCEVEVFQSTLPNGKPAEWHIARDAKTDTVWLERVVDASPGAGVTELGTYKSVVVAGALSAKPIDYRSQLIGMEEGKDFKVIEGSPYASLKPLLDAMPWVKDYRKAALASS